MLRRLKRVYDYMRDHGPKDAFARLRNIDPTIHYWTTETGKWILIKDLTDEHLFNILILYKHKFAKKCFRMNLLTAIPPQGEMAQLAYDQACDLWDAEEYTWIDFAMEDPTFRALIDEASNRTKEAANRSLITIWQSVLDEPLNLTSSVKSRIKSLERRKLMPKMHTCSIHVWGIWKPRFGWINLRWYHDCKYCDARQYRA